MTPKPLQLKRLRTAEVPPSDEAPRAEFARPIVPAALHGLIPIAILALWAVAIDGIRLRDMTDIGLISVMPVGALLLLALLTVSFCLALHDQPVRPWVAFMHVVVLIVMLYGVDVFLDPEARSAVVYRHLGIIDHIIQNGTVDPNIDAYFNWPGFFALGAVISQAAGLDSARELAPWAPLLFNFLYLPPLLVIFRWATADQRVWWLGLWVFFSANWVGQDYLSPQTLSFLLWLSILAALLTSFTPRPEALGTGLRGIRARARAAGEAIERAGPPWRAAGIVLMVVLMYAAMVSGHQLTPFAAVLGVGALVIFAGLHSRRLPIIMALLLGAWISYQTTPYLVGHIEALTGPLGSTSTNLNQNVAGRVGGSSDHRFIVNLRVAGSAAIWLLAVAGLVRRFRARRRDVAFVVLGATPFLLPIIQPYGGEMLLRVFFLTLPVVAFLIASLAFPTVRDGRSWRSITAVVLICFGLLGLFQFMRYGNERLDYFTKGDLATVAALYRTAKPGATLVSGGNTPWKYKEYAGYKYSSITTLRSWKSAKRPRPAALAAEISRTGPRQGSYVMVTRSAKVNAELLAGKPGVLERLVALLTASPSVKKIYHGVDGDIFHVPYGAAAPEARLVTPAEKLAEARRRQAAARAAASRARARAARARARARARRSARPAARPPAAPATRVRPRPIVPLRPAPAAPPPAAPRPRPSVPFDDLG